MLKILFAAIAYGSLFISYYAGAVELRINQIQFVGSHNSYKLSMSKNHFQALNERNPQAARSLEYHHPPLTKQLDLGLRKLELDIFNTQDFVVGHVQDIDMNSSCSPLSDCFEEILAWSTTNKMHVPIWISFNTKDSKIPGLTDPKPFDEDAFDRLDGLIEQYFNDRLIRPSSIERKSDNTPTWPLLNKSRGHFLFVLDEQAEKRQLYEKTWRARPMFTTSDENAESAAILVINDPLAQLDRIKHLVEQGFMIRTRSDADTIEARTNATERRDSAFASGAQAISTDYYENNNPFNTAYKVQLPGSIRCNPVSAPVDCKAPIE